MELETTSQGERYVHQTLWATALKMMENAAPQTKGTAYDTLAAMVFALHAFEAYLNYVGVKLDPNLWEGEREYFKKQPYRGFSGKVRKIFEMVGLDEPSRDIRPYKTIISLKELRDTIAHGHVIPINQTVLHSVNEAAPSITLWATDLKVSHQLAMEAMDDVGEVALMIHAAARDKITDPWFIDVPFGGAHAWTGHSTHAKDQG
jgi:hypothetical protein